LFFGKKISSLGDEELLLLYRRNGKQDVIGELFSRYSHLVFGLCMKYLKNKEDARDATFSLFEKLIGDLRENEVRVFSHWLCTVSRNHCLMILRKRTVDQDKMAALPAEATVVQDALPGTKSEAEQWETHLSNLEKAINTLNEAQRICVKLFYLQEKSYRQISDITSYSTNEVKSHIQNGRRNLKIHLTGNP